MEPLRQLISRQTIEQRVRELAEELSRDYQGRSPLFLGVLKGCYIFLADLTRRMAEPPEIDFIQLSSYGLKGTESAGRVEVCLNPRSELRGRHIVIVEDIVDSGVTLRFLRDYVAQQQPAGIRVCALLVRERTRAALDDLVDYAGFFVGEGWLVGYGLDLAEKYRHLPDLHVVEGTP
ncbi:MAG TPA: hypoxanthine phosphoribosyltransferase [Dehalococcoidia bacterium]|nr:hypoxanthine phosphoribosyltransferase [Dehalococcoidia bacterium]